VVVALLVGGIEGLGLIADKIKPSGPFWDTVAMFNAQAGNIGYLIIFVFAASWAASAVMYRIKGYDQLHIGSAGSTTGS
jgi:high-affinity nickel-transport protein